MCVEDKLTWLNYLKGMHDDGSCWEDLKRKYVHATSYYGSTSPARKCSLHSWHTTHNQRHSSSGIPTGR